MKYFVYRNMTIERFFQNLDVEFSGYEDISIFSNIYDRYIWFYLCPLKDDSLVIGKEVKNYIDLFRLTISNIPQTKTIIAFTIHPIYTINTIKSSRDIIEACNYYNDSLYALSNEYSNIKVIDFSDFLSNYSSKDLIDWKYYFISQMALNPRYANSFQIWFKTQIESIELKRKKCLVLDFDNTLWSGILGEDGIEGIGLGGDYPGKAFLFFQKQIKELSKQGIIIAGCSKNNFEDVRELWDKHPEIILTEKYFSAYKINWLNKADNIRQLAEELNIGLDSMVFIDDNPTERAIVKQNIPEIEVPEFPEQPYQLPLFFKEIAEKYFSIYSLTIEDISKTEQYKQNAQRTSIKSMFTNMDQYIKSLEIDLKIEEVNNITLPRVAQLTQKTNQFNLTTFRYTESDIRSFIDNNDKIYTLSVSDRFGNNGLTGVIICKIQDNQAEIDSLLLSCRILGKRIEEAFVYYVLKELKENNIEIIHSKYIPTQKNIQVKEFYETLGFQLENENEGVKSYIIELKNKEIKLLESYKYN